MGLFGAPHEWPTSPKSVTHICHNYETWHSYAIPKEDPKNIWITWHLLSSADISIFSQEISKFCYIKKYGYRFHFSTWFLIILTFLESLKIVLINMVTILIMSAKMATPGLLKLKIFWDKLYDVIISVHDITNEISSHDPNYFVDVVM